MYLYIVVLNLHSTVDIPVCPGICSEVEDGAPMIILELMEFGDLKNFLIDNKYEIVCLLSPCCMVVMVYISTLNHNHHI